MDSNKEKFLKLVSGDAPETREWMLESYKKRNLLKASQMISINIRKQLKLLNMTQKELAQIMGVSPQQVNKWVKGRENYTLETLLRLNKILGMELITVNPVSDRKMYASNEDNKQNIVAENPIHLDKERS